jgi:uncharacterized protein
MAVEVQRWLMELPQADCERLLADCDLGRLAVIVEGRPEIFPVNHVYEAGRTSIAFATMAGTKLHGALDWPWVAYEVDGMEDDGRAGWSVMVVGHVEEITDQGEIEQLTSQRGPGLWASGEAARWLRIVPKKMTGRRVSLGY